MSAAQLEQVRSAALGLPEDDRVKLTNELLLSLHEKMDTDVAAAWDVEICRRINEIAAGKAGLINAEDVIAKAKALIGT